MATETNINPPASCGGFFVPANDNNIAWPDYGRPDVPTGSQINVIASDGVPSVLRSVAIYYRQKEESWADSLALRLDAAARLAWLNELEVA